MKDVNLLVTNGVNIEKSLELFGDMDTYNSTLSDFLSDIDEKKRKIKNYKEIGDMANYTIYVHGLKSDAKYFGFDALANYAYQHEMAGKENNMFYVTEHFDELMLELERIVHLIKQYLGLEDGSVQTVIQESKAEKAIIVVDDSFVIKTFIQKIFHNDFEILMASDGREALQLVQERANKKIVGMLLDLHMPNVNGFQVLEYFKEHSLFDEIPVSIITGVGDNNLVARAFEYPIVDIIKKPFNERDIKMIVEKTVQYAH